MRSVISGMMGLMLSVLCGSQGSAAVLMGSWKLDGNANDSSGNGMDGTIYGSLTWLPGGGAHFDGAANTNFIEIPNSSAWNFESGGFTLKASVRYTDPQPFRGTAIISKHTSGVASGYGLMVQSPEYNNQLGLMVQPGDAPPDRIYGGTHQDGNWHDVVGTYDGTVLSLYVDGTLKAQNTLWNYSSFNDVNVRIGYFFPGDDNKSFLGDIKDVQIYSGVPEPSTLVLLGIGTISLLAYVWRRRKRTA